MKKSSYLILGLGIASVLLFLFDLTIGSSKLSIAEVWQALFNGESDAINRDIVLKIRLLSAVMAVLSGLALSASGLLMQTLFNNPLAGPYVLGVSSGASLGVAIFILGAPIFALDKFPLIESLGMAGAAWIGSAVVLVVIMSISRKIKDIMVILILGMMASSAISSVVEILQFLSNEASLKSFVVWSMGSLGNVSSEQLYMIAPVILLSVVLCILAIKPLDILLLGENYARTMGLNISRTRTLIFSATILLSGTITAFCGPIGFVGLAVPHLARIITRSAQHKILMPTSMLLGVIMMLVCDIISKSTALPINTITALMGIPIVILVVIKGKNIF
ncbi:MAG: iron ABC transporter permease [Rikenellaceae bacterium]